MQAIWVLENVKGDKSFYSKLELLILVASICLWKKHHPTHNTALYCDEMTNQVLGDLKVLHLWDEVNPLSYPEKINREVFWSSCKSKIISETQIPIVVVDHDFLIYTNIDEHLNDRVIYTYNERANNWYPKENNKVNRSLTKPVKYVNDFAANVSLLYLPDPEFAREYAKQVLQNHIEFSAMYIEDLSANYMILSEQLMLKQWLSERDIPHIALAKNVWDCYKITYIDSEEEEGLWSFKEVGRYFKHYGTDKSRFKENREGFDYEKEIEFLFRCIKSSKLHDVEELKKKIKVIENV
jgi:hypothetical protein